LEDRQKARSDLIHMEGLLGISSGGKSQFIKIVRIVQHLARRRQETSPVGRREIVTGSSGFDGFGG
jgi:hypothetical protein